jgi:DNA-binding NarL/FixJ family response regulator
MHLAMFDDERALAAAVAPQLLRCRDGGQVTQYFGASEARDTPEEHLAAAIVLCWSADSQGAYDEFRTANRRAIERSDLPVAVCALERFAHHALLFGDVARAGSILDEAVALSARHALPEWMLRCAAAAARIAIDTGDLARASALFALARPHARERDARALLAPVGVGIAVEERDDAAFAYWSSSETVDAALLAADPSCATSATIAILGEAGMPDADVRTALRRALLLSLGSTENVELFSLAARYAELDEARLAADALVALVASERAYVKAHALLARAHVLVRCGERNAGVDRAGDAARAFSAMGLRRWMNEAMMLLLRPDGTNASRQRGRRSDGAALTGREQQVAHLIRRGASNREVAVALQISEHTVERHVSSILGRLGLRSRWQIGDRKDANED